MTWTARCVVQEVGVGPAPIKVLLSASADETWAGKHLVRYDGDPGQLTGVYEDVELPRVVSNTEGRISSVEVRLSLDEDATSLAVGDEVTLSGHFQGAPAR